MFYLLHVQTDARPFIIVLRRSLPGAADVPSTDERGKVQTRLDMMDQQRSNIVAVSVSPGISRADTLAPWLRADRKQATFSWAGLIAYVLPSPILT